MTQFNNDEVISLYFAIYKHFNHFEFRHIVRELGINSDVLWGESYSDEIRELIFTMQRRERLIDLVNTCIKNKPDFDWRNQPARFAYKELPSPLQNSQIVALLSTYFSASELRQLCFYLGVDFGSVPGYLLSEQQTSLSEIDKNVLGNYDIELEKIPIGEVQKFLKEEWGHELLSYLERRGWPISKLIDMMAYMRPEIFNTI